MDHRIMIVLIEWRPSLNKVTVRGCWPKEKYRSPELLEPGNIQHAVSVFEGMDHKSHVGFEGLTVYEEELDQPKPKEGLYRKSGLQPLTPWTPDTDMDGVSVSEADAANGSPKAGDMIAHNPKDKTDRWLVAADFFIANYEPADTEWQKVVSDD